MEGTADIQAPVARSLPRIGDPAPQFTADTTWGTLKLEDFKDSWLILFSHPADFTPVCTTECIAFAEIHPQLRAMNTEPLGLVSESKPETSRAVFVTDDKQIVRAIIYYPLPTGRNMQEILRLVTALQTTDANGVATPANWEPGQQVIIPPPKTMEAAEARVEEEGAECTDWYFCKKDL